MWVEIVAVAGLLAVAPAPESVEPEPDAVVVRRIVRVVIGGTRERREPTRTLIDDLLREIDADVHLESRAGIDQREILFPGHIEHAAAHVFVDLAAPDHVTVFIVDGDYARILVRKIQHTAGFDEAAREQIAQVTRASIEALLSGAIIGLTFEEVAVTLELAPPPVDASVPPLPAPAPRTPGFDVTAGYAASVWSHRAAPLHGPVLRASIFGPGKLALGGSITVASFLSIVAPVGTIDVHIAGLGARGQLGLWVQAAERVSWIVEVGAGADILFIDSGQIAATRAFPFVTMRTGPSWHLLAGPHHLSLTLAAHVDFDLLGMEFQADDGQVAFEPWPARPGLIFVLGYGRR